MFSPAPLDPCEDSMWKAVTELSGSKGLSFESLNFAGHYLRHEGAEVVLEKSDGSDEFKRSATFLREPGLADAAWSSFRVADLPNGYLRQADGALRAEPVVSPADKAQALLRLTQEGDNAGLSPVSPRFNQISR